MRTERLIKLFEELMHLQNEIVAVTIQIYTELGMKCDHKHVDPHVIMQCSECGREIKQ